VHSSLGIHSLLKRQPLKHNVIDRDKVVVPPNWDSWGKIRVLREGFDVEAVSKGWSVDIAESHEYLNSDLAGDAEAMPTVGGAVDLYEDSIRDPSLDALQATATDSNGHKLEVSSTDPQTFLASQLEVLDKIRQDASGMDNSRLARVRRGSNSFEAEESHADEGRVNEHIGPVQFNMGGIQVDADDMLQRLRVRIRSFPL
jgi:dynein light intermediate chain 1